VRVRGKKHYTLTRTKDCVCNFEPGLNVLLNAGTGSGRECERAHLLLLLLLADKLLFPPGR